MRTHPRTTPIITSGLLVFFALCSIALASRARAGEVHFDPESPAGKEYALPLQQARNEALGGGGEPGGGGAGEAGSGVAAPLFGVGVGGAGDSKDGGTRPRSSQRPGEGRKTRSQGQGQEGDRGAPAPTPAVAAGGSHYPGVQGLLLLAGILVLGSALGLGLRAFGRQRATTG